MCSKEKKRVGTVFLANTLYGHTPWKRRHIHKRTQAHSIVRRTRESTRRTKGSKQIIKCIRNKEPLGVHPWALHAQYKLIMKKRTRKQHFYFQRWCNTLRDRCKRLQTCGVVSTLEARTHRHKQPPRNIYISCYVLQFMSFCWNTYVLWGFRLPLKVALP